MIGLDTNVLLRYLLQDDPTQSPLARDIIDNRISMNDTGYISMVVVLEIVWVMSSSYRLTQEQIVSAIRHLLLSRNFTVQNEREVFFAMSLYESNAGDFADALVSTLGTAAGCSSTLTFDRKAARLSGFSLIEG